MCLIKRSSKTHQKIRAHTSLVRGCTDVSTLAVRYRSRTSASSYSIACIGGGGMEFGGGGMELGAPGACMHIDTGSMRIRMHPLPPQSFAPDMLCDGENECRS